MNNLAKNQILPSQVAKVFQNKRFLILTNFFLIIFVYHLLKDLKDTLVITSSDVGAEVIPFIKIWGILPLSFTVSYLLIKLNQKIGREKCLVLFIATLLSLYAFFAFILYPMKDELYFKSAAVVLKGILPGGYQGFISLISGWIYTLFYLSAEMWGMLILSVMFWGYVNDISSIEEAKSFYPLCTLTGNVAGIVSGQTSRFLCHGLTGVLSWESTLKIIVILIVLSGLVVIAVSRRLTLLQPMKSSYISQHKKNKVSFIESLSGIFQSPQLFCIALLVVGFGLTTNLVEVIWKDLIKKVHPSPQAYNAYVNQLTSIIGLLAVIMSLISRWIFQNIKWSIIVLITPLSLFLSCSLFFMSFHLPATHLEAISGLFKQEPIVWMMTLGSIYYVISLTAKYTLFDVTKEMAFLTLESEQRMRGKSVIDSVGSRIGKSGSSCIFQLILLLFGSTSGQAPLVGFLALLVISSSVIAAKKLSKYMQDEPLEVKAL